ncbi:MAG TPA: hypothetical protein VKF28_04590 [Candidatus Dormibacteraeota bacterium]|nr:hypothetical protein [Candidatus Dormibacteraeota bacterium]
MPRTERDPLGPTFARRLRFELDRVQPPWSSPRYLGPARRFGAWRVAPAALAIALTSLLGLTAFAATGSANPAVWTERVVTVIHPAPPTPTPEVTPSPAQPRGAPPVQPTEKPEPSDRPEETSSPEPIESPEPGGNHSGSSSNLALPTPDDR